MCVHDWHVVQPQTKLAARLTSTSNTSGKTAPAHLRKYLPTRSTPSISVLYLPLPTYDTAAQVRTGLCPRSRKRSEWSGGEPVRDAGPGAALGSKSRHVLCVR